MAQKTPSLTLCLLGFLTPAVCGFQSDDSSVARTFSQTAVLTNSIIVVSVNFTNRGPGALRGFFYTDQVPSGLTVATLSVTVNEQGVTNCSFESGREGDVYPRCTPYRWVLEQPPAFSEPNPIPLNASAQIVYAISSSAPGSFDLRHFSWVGNRTGGTNSSFGYGEDADQRSVTFLTTSTPTFVAGQFSTNIFTLQLVGVPGLDYLIEGSTNLCDWVPLVTNTASFTFIDGNATGYTKRFYRARLSQ